jgi:hypothetical protein
VFCQVEISATGRSLVQRLPTICGVSECYLDTSTMRGPTPTRAVRALRKVCNPLTIIKLHKYFQELTFLFCLSMKSSLQNGIFLFLLYALFHKITFRVWYFFSSLFHVALFSFIVGVHWVAWHCKTNQDKYTAHCFNVIHRYTVQSNFTWC